MEEKWRNVPGYEGLYKVSNTGKVVNSRTNKELKNIHHKQGFQFVNLNNRSERQQYLIHRLVAQAFLKDFTQSSKVIHIDGNKSNNYISNLKCVLIPTKERSSVQKLTNFESEEWRNIEGYPDYLVSNLGRVKSFKLNKAGIILKRQCDSHGYPQLQLTNTPYVYDTIKVHRLVAKAFVPNPNNYIYVNHKNGIRNDPRSENLEWCTNQQNVIHSFAVLKRNRVDDSIPMNKLHETEVLDIFRLAHEGRLTQKTIASKFDISPAMVLKIKNGRLWGWLTHKQFVKKNHTHSKLSEDDAKNIFFLAWSGKYTQQQIASKYNISGGRVSAIKLKQSFVNVTQNLDENCIPEEYL